MTRKPITSGRRLTDKPRHTVRPVIAIAFALALFPFGFGLMAKRDAAPIPEPSATWRITANLSDCTPPSTTVTPMVTFTVREIEADSRVVIGCTRYAPKPIPTYRLVRSER